MNSDNFIVSINSIKDINKINKNTKYINISINNVDIDVIDYFLLHGQKFSYSDIIDDKNGFLYADYSMFNGGETIINGIIDSMPCNLNDIEKIRYIYINLGKILSIDINVSSDKNETISYGNISTVNNLWSAIIKGKATDISVSKLFMYICCRLGIKCELISSSIKGSVANKVYLDDSFLVVDLYNDIYNIQGGFVTKFFDKYNNDKNMDKKISYIKDDYSDYYLDRLFKNINYSDEDIVYRILSLSSGVINIDKIGTMELFKIYLSIFDKYCPNYDIRINNFFVYGSSCDKEHFIVISYNDKYYSFNYSKNCFTLMGYDILSDNLKKKKIGLYDGELFYNKEKSMVL